MVMIFIFDCVILQTSHRELSTRVFETGTVTGSELFSLLTCPHTNTFALLSIFSPLIMSSMKSRRQCSPSHVKCFLPVAVRVSETRVLKLPISAKVLKSKKATTDVVSINLVCLLLLLIFSCYIVF